MTYIHMQLDRQSTKVNCISSFEILAFTFVALRLKIWFSPDSFLTLEWTGFLQIQTYEFFMYIMHKMLINKNSNDSMLIVFLHLPILI